jgi:hypothetical protein
LNVLGAPPWNRTIALSVHMMRPDEHRQEKTVICARRTP